VAAFGHRAIAVSPGEGSDHLGIEVIDTQNATREPEDRL